MPASARLTSQLSLGSARVLAVVWQIALASLGFAQVTHAQDLTIQLSNIIDRPDAYGEVEPTVSPTINVNNIAPASSWLRFWDLSRTPATENVSLTQQLRRCGLAVVEYPLEYTLTYDVAAITDRNDIIASFGLQGPGTPEGPNSIRGVGAICRQDSIEKIQLEGYELVPAAVASNGTIVGSAFARGQNQLRWRGFIYRNGQPQLFDYPGADETYLHGVNARGDLVGKFKGPDGWLYFVQIAGIISPMPANIAVFAVNDAGQVLGRAPNSQLLQAPALYYSGAWRFLSSEGVYRFVTATFSSDGRVFGRYQRTGQSLATLFTAELPKLVAINAEVFDGTSVATSANANDGILYDIARSAIGETKIARLTSAPAKGLVADGNSRLIVRVKTSAPGTVTATLSDGTSAKLYPMVAGGSTSETGATQATQEVATGTATPHQASFTLKAGYDYKGKADQKLSNFAVDICFKAVGSSTCDATQRVNLAEKRAPVILVHGLWSNNQAFETRNVIGADNKPKKQIGLRQALLAANYSTTLYSFDGGRGGAEGPSLTMTSTQKSLANSIKRACRPEILDGYGCTRATLVAHSMGALVARKYVFDNVNYKQPFNYNQGSVVRIVAVGAPNLGSPVADALLAQLPCAKANVNGIYKIYALLELNKMPVRSGVFDLYTNSSLLSLINASQPAVPMRTVAGDLGANALDIPYSPVFTFLAGCSESQIFNGKRTDGIVPIDSAHWNINSPTTVPGSTHMNMGSNDGVNAAVLRLLATPTQ